MEKLPVLYIVVPCYNEEEALPLSAPVFRKKLADLEGKIAPESRVLFVDEIFYRLSELRDVEVDFGIIPYPRFDDQQAEYYSRVEAGARIGMIPITNKHPEYAGALLEAMSSYGYNRLGQPASHGCIRLAAGNAKYIYDNVPIGTPVTVFHGSAKDDPLGKPASPHVGSWSKSYDPSDPTI